MGSGLAERGSSRTSIPKTWILAWIVLATGCGGPAIRSFEITPVPGGRPDGAITTTGLVEVCSGERVAARWETKGGTAMVLRVGDPRFAIQEEGEEPDPLAPDTLEVTLVAGPAAEEVVRTIAVLQFPDTSRTVVAFSTTLEGDTLVAAGRRGDRDLDGRFTVDEVTNPLDRPLRVLHGGEETELGPGETSDDLRGTPLGGDWELRSVMTDEERSTPAIRPTSLSLEATIHCEPRSS